MSELELDKEVRRLLKSYGLYGYHTHDSRRSAPGFPDWVIVGSRVLYRELKAEYGKMSSEQTTVRYLLIAAGADWDVWRPSDLTSGRVARELSALCA